MSIITKRDLLPVMTKYTKTFEPFVLFNLQHISKDERKIHTYFVLRLKILTWGIKKIGISDR